MTDRNDIMRELQWLTSAAIAAGADQARALRCAEAVVDLILDNHDPRTVATLDLARRVHQARQAGVAIPDLCRRFGRSRATIYRLIAVSRHRETAARSNGSSP